MEEQRRVSTDMDGGERQQSPMANRRPIAGTPIRPSVAQRTSQETKPRETMREEDSKMKEEGFMAKLLGGVVTVSLAALFFGLPIFFTGMTLQGIAFEKQVYFYFWILIGLVSWISKGVVTGEMHIRKTPLDVPILLFAGAYIVSAAFSIDRWHSFWGSYGDPSRGVIGILAIVGAYYLIVSHMTRGRIFIVLAASLLSSFVVMIWTLLAIYNIQIFPESIAKFAPVSLLGSMTALGVFLGASLPLFVAASASAYGLGDRAGFFRVGTAIFLGVGILLNLFLIYALFAYISWAAVIVGFAFFLLYILAKVIAINERIAWLPMVTLVVLLAFYMVGQVNIIKANLPLEAAPNPSLSWKIAKEALSQDMFLGSGPSTYGYAFSMYRPQEYNLQLLSSLRFQQGTGVLFEAMATLGALGTGTIIVLVLSFISVGFYLLAQHKEEDKILSLGLWSMSMVYVIAAIMGQFNGAVLMVGGIMIAFAFGVLMKESRSEEVFHTLSLQSSPKFALALAFVFLVASAGVAFAFAFVGKAYWADALAFNAMQASPDTNDSTEKMGRSRQLMVREGRYSTYLGQIAMAMAMREAQKPQEEQNAEALQQYIEASGPLLSIGRDMSPKDIVAQEAVAQNYESMLSLTGARQDLLEKIFEEYKKASELEPHNPAYYVKMGQVKRALANAEKSEDQKKTLGETKDLFQKAVDEKADYVAAHYNLGLTHEALGDFDAALQSVANAIAINPQSQEVDSFAYDAARILRQRDKEGDLDKAEGILKQLLEKNEKHVDAAILLGMVYEQKGGKKTEAIEAYQKAFHAFDDQDDQFDKIREQIQKLIDNVRAGKSNLDQSAPSESQSVSQPQSEQGAETVGESIGADPASAPVSE